MCAQCVQTPEIGVEVNVQEEVKRTAIYETLTTEAPILLGLELSSMPHMKVWCCQRNTPKSLSLTPSEAPSPKAYAERTGESSPPSARKGGAEEE